MKEYFSHDYSARTDRKLVCLQMKYGMAGIGIYWCLVEIIYENGGFIPEDECESVSYELRTEYERIISVLRDFELFYQKDGFYRSESIDRRLETRTTKSESAKKSINARWERIGNQKLNTNVLRTNNECNTIKGKGIVKEDIKITDEIPILPKPVSKPKADFVTELIELFKESFIEVNGFEFEVTNKGKERAAIGGLLTMHRKQHPEQTSDEVKFGFKTFFDQCNRITDPFLQKKMSPNTIYTEIMQIKKILLNGNSKSKPINGASKQSVVEEAVKSFGLATNKPVDPDLFG